jgi:hypothetical protein
MLLALRSRIWKREYSLYSNKGGGLNGIGDIYLFKRYTLEHDTHMYYRDSTLTFILSCGASIAPKCVMPWMPAVIYI